MSKETSLCRGANLQILLKFLNKLLCSALNYRVEKSELLIVQNKGGQDSKIHLGNV